MDGVIRLRFGTTSRSRRVMRVLVPLLVVSLIVQLLVGTEPNAFIWSAAAAGTILLTIGYCLRRGPFDDFPLSTLALVGFNTITLDLPLLVQSLTGRSFLYNLHDPDETFTWILLTHAVLVGTHFLYTALRPLHRPAQILARRVFAPLTLFRTPTAIELWALGFVGLVATIFSLIVFVADIQYGDVGGKALSGFLYFTAFPFLIPLRGAFGGRKVPTSPITPPLLVLYFTIVVIVGIATNKRLTFSFVAETVLVAALLLSAMGRLVTTNRFKLVVGTSLLLSLPLFGLFENLTTAIEMSRGAARTSVSGTANIDATLQALGDQAAIDRYRRDNEETGESSIAYSEDYLSSPILNRLVYTKYTDITMTASRTLTDSQRATLQYDAIERLKGILPTPIAHQLGIGLDKSAIEYSTGDLYESFASGRPPDSFLTGSSITQSRDVFGRFWLFTWFGLFLLLFNACDSLTLANAKGVVISPLAFALLFTIFTHTLIDDNFVALFSVATRDLLQNVLFYLVTITLIRFVVGVLVPRVAPIQARA